MENPGHGQWTDMKPWKPVWILAIVAGLVIVGALVGASLFRRRAKVRNKKKVNDACGASPDARVPVFVMLQAAGHADATATLQTLLSLFANAHCPLRVFVGLAEYTDAGTDNERLPARFARAAEASTMPFRLADHVRALHAPLHEHPGHWVAVEQVQRYLYRAEPFVLLVAPGVLMLPQWDTHLVAALQDAPPKTVLTCNPPPVGTPGTLGTFQAIGSATPTFVTFSIRAPVEGALPKSIPALSWCSRMSFTRGPLPLGDAAALVQDPDAAMTCRLLVTGWVLHHPTARVAVGDRQLSPSPSPSPLPPRILLAPAVAHHLGIDQHLGTVSARGRLGLVPAPNPAYELTAKVGSSGDVLSMLSRLEVAVQKKNLATT